MHAINSLHGFLRAGGNSNNASITSSSSGLQRCGFWPFKRSCRDSSGESSPTGIEVFTSSRELDESMYGRMSARRRSGGRQRYRNLSFA
jgi:hypothetical protein